MAICRQFKTGIHFLPVRRNRRHAHRVPAKAACAGTHIRAAVVPPAFRRKRPQKHQRRNCLLAAADLRPIKKNRRHNSAACGLKMRKLFPNLKRGNTSGSKSGTHSRISQKRHPQVPFLLFLPRHQPFIARPGLCHP